jgi:peptidoglycan hydrolase-like protein with peptidoglycan-binding domain
MTTTTMPSRRSPRRARALLAAAALATGIMLAPAGDAFAMPTLESGDDGPAVRALQRALKVQGADGIFGPGTELAVRKFQLRHRVNVDGVVGPGTWALIRRGQRQRARASAGAGAGARVQTRGGSVRVLQKRLGIGTDGVFGPGTARAVRRFQREHGLTADGVVGPATWSALGIPGSRPVLKRARLRRSASAARTRSTGVPVQVTRAIAAANRIATLPYRYGGGHGSFVDTGYDCSGSVSYVLHAAGALSSPLDSGSLMSWGEAGPGRWITVYANPGHTYMVINGRRYDTTGRGQTGSRWQDEQRSSAGYVVRHPAGL